MYLNLMMVMKKHKITNKALAKELGMSERSFYSKINGLNDWTFGEVKGIWQKFPDEDPDFLMEKSNA